MLKLPLPRALQTMKFLGAWLGGSVVWLGYTAQNRETTDDIRSQGTTVCAHALSRWSTLILRLMLLALLIIVCCLSRSTLKVMSHRSLPERRERLAERTC